jgi:hypothetical protein
MDLTNLGTNFSLVRDHLALFVSLLFGLPVVSFVGIKFWIAGRSAKVQRSTNWFVPTDLESDAAKMHYSMQHNSVAFAHRVHRASRHATAVRDSSSRRSV